MKYSQPVISRETRLLLTTIVVSVAALWLLARIRFQEQPTAADPVPPVLAQLRPQSSFDDMARLIGDMRTTIGTWMFEVDGKQSALRLRDVAFTLGPVDSEVSVMTDRPTGLTLVRRPPGELPGPMPWVPRVLEYPRYFVAAEHVEGRLLLRPVYVSGLFATRSALWGDDVWRVAEGTAMRPGTFVFTTQAALAGLVISVDGGIALVPGARLLTMVEELLQRGQSEPGEIGTRVGPLTPSLSAATDAKRGLVVTAVDAGGPAAAVLRPTDVIEVVNGRPLSTIEEWRSVVGRLSAGELISLSIRRAGIVQDVQVVAARDSRAERAEERGGTAEDAPLPQRRPGFRLRTLPNRGALVIAVEPWAAAGRAGLRAGDVITVAGQLDKPTGAQVMDLLRNLDDSGAVLVALSRGDEHHVVALAR